MNERVMKLWTQAGGHYNSGNQHTWPQYVIDNPEKFAELIVQECIHIVEQHRFAQEFQDEYEEGYADGMGRAERLIKEHFGGEVKFKEKNT